MNGVRERGSASLELVVMVPALLVLIGVLVLAGRVQLAAGVVERAAAEAARAASISRTSFLAQDHAGQIGRDALASQGLECSSTSVVVDTSAFAVPVGRPGVVTVTVACTVPLSDLGVPGLPGSRTITSQASSALDTFRERAGGIEFPDASNLGVLR